MIKKINQRLTLPIIGTIKLYQHTLSPDKGFPSRRLKWRICHHQPHCSEYAIQALKQYGFYPGVIYMLDRISSCTGAVSIKHDPIQYKVVFFSSAPIGVPFLEKIANDLRYNIVGVVSNSEKKAWRGMQSHTNIITKTAQKLWIPHEDIQTPSSLRLDSKHYAQEANTFSKRLISKKPDFLVVIAYGKIIPQHILDTARIAPINVHGSVLPYYRGASPIQSVFLNNETSSWMTIMKMDAGLDTWDSIRTLKTQLPFSWTAQDLMQRMQDRWPKLLTDTLREYAKGRLESKKQDEKKATQCGKLQKEQGQINPIQTPLKKVYNIYRACYLRPKTYFVLDEDRGKHSGKRIIIENMQLNEQEFETSKDLPLFISHNQNLQTNSAVTKLTLKPEGKQAIERKEFIKGYHYHPKPKEERLDLVDPNDKIIAKETRENIYKHKLSNFRCVNILIQNTKKEILIPLRDRNRKIFPNCFDFSCWEHVESGETYLQAAIRWLQEELQISIESSEIKELIKLTPQQHHVSCFQTIYLLTYNQPIKGNAKEWVQSLKRMNMDTIVKKIKKEPDAFKSDMIIVLQHIQNML